MDTRTGIIRPLSPEEQPTANEIALTNRQARRLKKLTPEDRIEWAACRTMSPVDRKARKRHRKARKRHRKLQRAARKANRS
jgi:hypothetical protein